MTPAPLVKSMRDVLIKNVYESMKKDKSIFFLSADFGSPVLDDLRRDFKDRFINVGIAEQNLVNVATGLALEGCRVYCYAIAPFLSMRCCEQVRVNLSILSQLREVNINLVGVGAGLSYDLSGPTHHCFEDIGIMRSLPQMTVFSPSDWALTQMYMTNSIKMKKPVYIRLDGKPLPQIYDKKMKVDFEKGFHELRLGKDVGIVSTGYMTHKALSVAATLSKNRISVGVIDLFILKPVNEEALFDCVSRYKKIVTLEEGIVDGGGVSTILSTLLANRNSSLPLKKMGFGDHHVFKAGSREYLHRIYGLGFDDVEAAVTRLAKSSY